MNIRYRVELSEAERSELEALLSGGKHAAWSHIPPHRQTTSATQH